VTRAPTDELARALLASFAEDEVPRASRERAFMAFGVAAGATSVATTATAVAEVAGAAAPGAAISAKGAAVIGGVSAIKAMMIGAALGGAVVYAGEQVSVFHAPEPIANSPMSMHPGAHASHLASNALEVLRSAPMVAEPPTATSTARKPNDPSSVVGDVAAGKSEAQLTAVAEALRPKLAPIDGVVAAAKPVETRNPQLAHHGGEKPRSEELSLPAEDPAPHDERSVTAKLTGEIARLDRARAALRDGSPIRATRELNAYDAEFTDGKLHQEATILRIELLVMMGDDETARATADAFAASNPRSGYLRKIRELLARRRKMPRP
jgi:hypothetical protein